MMIIIIMIQTNIQSKHRGDLGRGDLSVCPLGGFTGACEYIISAWRGVDLGSPQGQTLRALLLRGTSVLH